MARFDDLHSNREVDAFATAHGLRWGWHPALEDDPECREKILPCLKVRGGSGYWWWRGPGLVAFYHPSRRDPDRDFEAIRALAPSATNHSGEDEPMVYLPVGELPAVLAKGPDFCRVKSRRRVTEAMRAAGFRLSNLMASSPSPGRTRGGGFAAGNALAEQGGILQGLPMSAVPAGGWESLGGALALDGGAR